MRAREFLCCAGRGKRFTIAVSSHRAGDFSTPGDTRSQKTSHMTRVRPDDWPDAGCHDLGAQSATWVSIDDVDAHWLLPPWAASPLGSNLGKRLGHVSPRQQKRPASPHQRYGQSSKTSLPANWFFDCSFSATSHGEYLLSDQPNIGKEHGDFALIDGNPAPL